MGDVSLDEPVVQPLVVGVVEALLLQVPLQIPVDLGHEQEAGMLFLDARDGVGPEGLSLDAPGAFEDVGEDEHGHVAADPVAAVGHVASSARMASCTAGLP